LNRKSDFLIILNSQSSIFNYFVLSFLGFLYKDKACIVAIALFNLLFVQTILERILLYQANSKTDLTADQAFKPVPDAAGSNLIIADLNL